MTQRHQRIQLVLRCGLQSLLRQLGWVRRERRALKVVALQHRGQVHDLIANGHAAAKGFTSALPPENSKGQVLNRKVAVCGVGRDHPTGQRWVVGFVQLQHRPNSVVHAAVVHPRGMFGGAFGLTPFFEHVPLHVVEFFHHLGCTAVGGQLESVAVGV